MEEFDTMNIRLDTYEVANLIGMMRRGDDLYDNGDWYCQILRKLIQAAKDAGITKLENNFEDNTDVAKLEASFNMGKWRINDWDRN